MYKKLLLNYGRNALRYIIRIYRIKELYLPYYLCNVIRHSVVKENCKPFFYHIDDSFYPTIKFPQKAYILYPNYFGVCDKNVENLVHKYPNLIVDNSHSFYSEPSGLACFNSARKFQKTLYGSELWFNTDAGTNINVNLASQTEFDISKYRTVEEYENNISNFPPMYIKDNLTIENNRTRRLEKFQYYHDEYSQINQLRIDINAFSPFCYPCLANSNKEADELVKILTKNGKTIYRYWQNMPKNYNEYKFYRRLVPIPLSSTEFSI